jgi:hypothetical protein
LFWLREIQGISAISGANGVCRKLMLVRVAVTAPVQVISGAVEDLFAAGEKSSSSK